MIRDCYTQDQQRLFEAGLADINQRSQNIFRSSFYSAKKEEQLALITDIDKEALTFNQQAESEWNGEKFKDQAHYFTLYKQLIIFSFFTSKLGSTQVLRHAAVPGRYEDIPYKKGDGAWAAAFPW
jgi:hypothetical protein